MAKSTIPLSNCEGSLISGIGHDPATNTLAIQFKGKAGPGATYHYPNVTAQMFADFKAAESKGRFFGSRIKDKPEHPHTKMVADEDEAELA